MLSERGPRSHGLFIVLGLAALLSSALVPLLHRHHATSEARPPIASAHSAHMEGCATRAPESSDHSPASDSNSPGHDDESSCPICGFVKSGQARGVILPPANHAIAPSAPVGGLIAPADWTPLSCGRPRAASPRAPPRSIA